MNQVTSTALNSEAIVGELERRTGLKGMIFLSGYRTLKAFGKRAGIDSARLSRYISGHEYPSDQAVKRMAEALRMGIEELREII